MSFKLKFNLFIPLFLVLSCTQTKSQSEVNVAYGFARKVPQIDKNLPSKLVPLLRPKLAQGDLNHKRTVANKTLIDLLVNDSEFVPWSKENSNNANKTLNDVIYKALVDDIKLPKSSDSDSIAKIYGHPILERTRFFYKDPDLTALQTIAEIKENLIGTVEEDINQRISKNKDCGRDNKKISQLRDLLDVLQTGFFPRTLADYSLDSAMVWRNKSQLDLPKTLEKSRKISLPQTPYQAVDFTPNHNNDPNLKKSDLDFVSLVYTFYYEIAGRVNQVKTDREELPGPYDNLLYCFSMLCNAVGNVTGALPKFDKILHSFPRSPGRVYRGIASFPKDQLEKWLSLGARGTPLSLGINNRPQPMFSSRNVSMASDYLNLNGEKRPNHYKVLLEIDQKNGVSIESIGEMHQQEVILLSSQKFKIVEIFSGMDEQEVYIKLKEI